MDDVCGHAKITRLEQSLPPPQTIHTHPRLLFEECPEGGREGCVCQVIISYELTERLITASTRDMLRHNTNTETADWATSIMLHVKSVLSIRLKPGPR